MRGNGPFNLSTDVLRKSKLRSSFAKDAGKSAAEPVAQKEGALSRIQPSEKLGPLQMLGSFPFETSVQKCRPPSGMVQNRSQKEPTPRICTLLRTTRPGKGGTTQTHIPSKQVRHHNHDSKNMGIQEGRN